MKVKVLYSTLHVLTSEIATSRGSTSLPRQTPWDAHIMKAGDSNIPPITASPRTILNRCLYTMYIYATYNYKENFGLIHVYFLYTVFRATYRAVISKVTCIYIYVICVYNLFQKTLPKSTLKMHWISVRFYEMGDTINIIYYVYMYNVVLLLLYYFIIFYRLFEYPPYS